MEKGFTLAEVLITLGVIGVVAAMTIPGLITEHLKRTTVTKLEKAISTINQAYKLSYDDVGEPISAYNLGSEAYFKTYWEPYIKVNTYCTSYSTCGYKEQAPFKHPNGKRYEWSVVLPTARATFYSMDNVLYSISTAVGNGYDGGLIADPNRYIVVDINGSDKPNILGKDVFLLIRLTDGGAVQPYSYNKSDEEVNSDCSSTSGMTCAEKIRRAGWKIEKDYPW